MLIKLPTFWREIKNVTNSKVKLPSRIGDVHGSNAVAGMRKEHYVSILNAVNESNCIDLHAELCDAHYVFDRSMSVSSSELRTSSMIYHVTNYQG